MHFTKNRYIYVFGNGFDIAANLPTRYIDFLFLVENWKEFFSSYNYNYTYNYSVCEMRNKKPQNECLSRPVDGKLSKALLIQYSAYPHFFKHENLIRLDEVFANNAWILYFQLCGYTEPGWAGFEKEIKEALISIDRLFQVHANISEEDISPHEKAIITIYEKTQKNVFLQERKPGFFLKGSQEEITNIRKKFIEFLADELLSFSEAFRLYLLEFVEKMSIETNKDFFLGINSYIISLNYTHNPIKNLFVFPDIPEIHWIHGSDELPENIVLGIENDNMLGNEYIRFKKFFQRIQKRTGTQYKDFFQNKRNKKRQPKSKVIFYGHSLDPVDKDFIQDIFHLATEQIIIQYHNQDDYEQKIINLVNIFGDDYIIDAVEKKRVVFTNESLESLPYITGQESRKEQDDKKYDLIINLMNKLIFDVYSTPFSKLLIAFGIWITNIIITKKRKDDKKRKRKRKRYY